MHIHSQMVTDTVMTGTKTNVHSTLCSAFVTALTSLSSPNMYLRKLGKLFKTKCQVTTQARRAAL
jgi:hypothetical protein